MEKLAEAYPNKKVVIIWDNLNIHFDGKVNRWTEFNRAQNGRFSFVYTPKHASWVNQIELFFGILERRCLRNGSFASETALNQTVCNFIDNTWNGKDAHPFRWTFTGYPLQEGRLKAA